MGLSVPEQPGRQLGVRDANRLRHVRDLQLSVLQRPCEDVLEALPRCSGSHTRTISHLGISFAVPFASGVAKSIYSPAQRQLTALLRDLRAEAGLRQVDMAERLQKPQSFVSKYEAGERRLDLVELREICQALGIGLVDLAQRFEDALAEE